MIKRLSIKDKKTIIILIVIALLIPVIVFAAASIYHRANNETEATPTPTQKPPLPTFPDAPRVENELLIRYAEGQEFHNLSSSRQQEIMALLESLGVISQEKAYEIDEGPLSRSHLLKFREGVDIEDAAQSIYELPEVENAQPNTEFGLF